MAEGDAGWGDAGWGGEVLVQTDPGSLKFRLADAAREFTLVAQSETSPCRYVSVSGPVVAIEAETSQADRESMTYRYLQGDDAADFLARIENAPIMTLRMRPQRWYSTDDS
ncbi:pyridoxamine 5'-phosphate oxidase family protein [Allokutzneria oryzae]|uniref:Pyridoxamine 5'-phosphate oxidase family protein n=1 Tax=Allokutzneria oryzae TaxID=1378989 RepID=A0ABV5ZXW7_9PSEU